MKFIHIVTRHTCVWFVWIAPEQKWSYPWDLYILSFFFLLLLLDFVLSIYLKWLWSRIGFKYSVLSVSVLCLPSWVSVSCPNIVNVDTHIDIRPATLWLIFSLPFKGTQMHICDLLRVYCIQQYAFFSVLAEPSNSMSPPPPPPPHLIWTC